MRTLDQTKDFVICGGGLQGCLLAVAIRHYSPQSKVVLIEKSDSLCGNHTWSFHDSDIPENAYTWFSNLVDFSWPNYLVRFGDFERQVPIGYGTIRSTSLATRVQLAAENSNGHLEILRGDVSNLDRNHVRLESGLTIQGEAVLDCRGVDRDNFSIANCGFQKFVGFELELKSKSTRHPILMDGSVNQGDGFHFIYTLPFSANRILVEDTRFSNSPDLSRNDSLATIQKYLRKRSVENYEIVREEVGCLPMPFGKANDTSPNTLGYRGNLFHAATGYSIPLAATLADSIGSSSASKALSTIASFKRNNRFRFAFSQWLNRMLFCLVKPETRHNIFERFYKKLSPQRIRRFYAHKFNFADALALVAGRPPSGLTPFRFLNSFGGLHVRSKLLR